MVYWLSGSLPWEVSDHGHILNYRCSVSYNLLSLGTRIQPREGLSTEGGVSQRVAVEFEELSEGTDTNSAPFSL